MCDCRSVIRELGFFFGFVINCNYYAMYRELTVIGVFLVSGYYWWLGAVTCEALMYSFSSFAG